VSGGSPDGAPRGVSGLRAARVAAQGIGASASRFDVGGAHAVGSLVRHMLALQGQDLEHALWAIGVRLARAPRSPAVTRSDVLDAFDSGAVVRSWPMRGTLHVIAPDDLRTMLSLTAERTVRQTARRRAQLGLDDRAIGRARDAVVGMLSGGGALSRADVLNGLTTAGLDVAGGRGYHLLFHLSQEALIAWGPIDRAADESGPARASGRPGGQRAAAQRLVLLDEWAPAGAVVDRPEALRRMVTGHLRGRGPSTDADIVAWSGLPLGEVRAGLASASDSDDVEPVGAGRWSATDVPAAGGVASAHLLPAFDEYLLGYADRGAQLDVEHAAAVVPGGNGVFLPMVIVRGAIVGTWRRTRDRVEVVPFVSRSDRPLSDRDEAAVLRAVEPLARFLGRTVHSSVSRTD
jgi:hypothetical protein